jgi:hypothetical protein
MQDLFARRRVHEQPFMSHSFLRHQTETQRVVPDSRQPHLSRVRAANILLAGNGTFAVSALR